MQVVQEDLPTCGSAALDIVRAMRSVKMINQIAERLRIDIRRHPAYRPEYGDGGMGVAASASGADTPRGLETERVNLMEQIRGSVTAAHVDDLDLRDLYRRLAQVDLATLAIKTGIARDAQAAEAAKAEPKPKSRRSMKNRLRPERQASSDQGPPLPPPAGTPSEERPPPVEETVEDPPPAERPPPPLGPPPARARRANLAPRRDPRAQLVKRGDKRRWWQAVDWSAEDESSAWQEEESHQDGGGWIEHEG